VCANAAEAHKLKLFVVGKVKNPRAFKNVQHLPVDYKAQSSAWMNLGLFRYWFHHIFVPAVQEDLRKIGRPEDTCVLLIIDDCKAHPPATELVSERRNICAAFLPPNFTSVIQPVDQGVIENLKSIYRRDSLRILVNYDGSHEQFISQYSSKDAVFNLACAWSAVKCITLWKTWRKLWPAVMFAEESSDEEKFKGFNISKKKGVVYLILFG
jgi:hypothetical protein